MYSSNAVMIFEVNISIYTDKILLILRLNTKLHRLLQKREIRP